MDYKPKQARERGLTLDDWIRVNEMSYSEFARLIPCSTSYPRLLAKGLAKPSYRMAVRIEKVTLGEVPRSRWFPPEHREGLVDDLLA